MQFTYSPLTNILTILNAVRLIFISSNLLHERQLTSFCCIFCFIGYLLLEKNKKGKKKKWKRDQVNQQCEKILIKTLSFPLLSVVNEQPWGDIWLCVNVHLQLSYAQFFSRSRSLPFQNHDIILTMSRYFTNNQLQKEE